jgi:uncharacterized protein (DUF736 family)
MNIGVVNQKKYTVGKGEDAKTIPYLELIVRPPFMESGTFTISQNKNKQNDNEPDWIIYHSFNRRGENYRRSRAGAIWNKTKDDLEYKTGHIDTPVMPNGRLNFTLFKAKPLENEDPAKITWAYDVVWNYYDPNKDENNTSSYHDTPAYHEEPTTKVPEINIDEDEIPF